MIYRHTLCPGVVNPLDDFTLVVFASPQEALPTELCPPGATGCSPVLTEPISDQVVVHTFVRVQYGTMNDTHEAPCTVGKPCSKMDGSFQLATYTALADGTTTCLYTQFSNGTRIEPNVAC